MTDVTGEKSERGHYGGGRGLRAWLVFKVTSTKISAGLPEEGNRLRRLGIANEEGRRRQECDHTFYYSCPY